MGKRPPLREIKKIDLFQAEGIKNELAEFQFDYFYSGKFIGERNTGLIELYVTTYLTDKENLFIRYSVYSGNGRKWKEIIFQQLRELMYACIISKEIVNAQIRFFEVDQSKQLNLEEYEKAFLNLKRKLHKD